MLRTYLPVGAMQQLSDDIVCRQQPQQHQRDDDAEQQEQAPAVRQHRSDGFTTEPRRHEGDDDCDAATPLVEPSRPENGHDGDRDGDDREHEREDSSHAFDQCSDRRSPGYPVAASEENDRCEDESDGTANDT